MWRREAWLFAAVATCAGLRRGCGRTDCDCVCGGRADAEGGGQAGAVYNRDLIVSRDGNCLDPGKFCRSGAELSSAQLLQLFSLRRPPRLSAGPPGYLAKLSLVRPFAALAVAWRVSVTVQDRADGTLTRPASPRLALAWRWRLRQGRQHGPLGFAG